MGKQTIPLFAVVFLIGVAVVALSFLNGGFQPPLSSPSGAFSGESSGGLCVCVLRDERGHEIEREVATSCGRYPACNANYYCQISTGGVGVCEPQSAGQCGNGVIDPGEGCDPPTAPGQSSLCRTGSFWGTCTPRCQCIYGTPPE